MRQQLHLHRVRPPRRPRLLRFLPRSPHHLRPPLRQRFLNHLLRLHPAYPLRLPDVLLHLRRRNRDRHHQLRVNRLGRGHHKECPQEFVRLSLERSR